MNNNVITNEQWQAWLLDPVTMALRVWARERREELRDGWESASFKSDNQFQSAMADSYAHGSCMVLRVVETLDYQSVIGDDKDVSATRSEDGPSNGEPSAGY